KDWGATGHFTPAELAFAALKNPTMHDRAQFTWRYEGVWVLLWALGFVDEIGRPDKVVDVPALATLMLGLGPTDLRTHAKMREAGQILDLLDITYRYHWACVDARINDRKTPGGLESDVVMERHYALNWLTRYGNQAWDDISTDT